jgi:hypothetical protein
MNKIFLITIINLISWIFLSEYYDIKISCNIKLLSYFNISGLWYPIINDGVQTDIENKFCGDIEYTCCSWDDLPKIREIWSKAWNKL